MMGCASVYICLLGLLGVHWDRPLALKHSTAPHVGGASSVTAFEARPDSGTCPDSDAPWKGRPWHQRSRDCFNRDVTWIYEASRWCELSESVLP